MTEDITNRSVPCLMSRVRMNETLGGALLINMGEHCSKRRVLVKTTCFFILSLYQVDCEGFSVFDG